jgi:hypothetical protein
MVSKAVTSRPPFSWRKKLLFCAIIWTLVLVGAEFLGRVAFNSITGGRIFEADPELGYVLRPGLNTRRRVGENGEYYHLTTNAQGRRIDPTWAPGREQTTVVLLGDSCTFGEGVDDDKTAAAYLAHSGFQVINLGVPGYGTNQELLCFRRFLADGGKADVVVTIVSNNDADEVRSPYLYMRHRPTASLAAKELQLDPFCLPWTDHLLDHSALFGLYRRFATSPTTYDGDCYAIVAACLASIQQDVCAAKLKPLFFVHDAAFPKAPRTAPYITAAERYGVSLIDLSPVLARRIAEGEQVICPDGAHWSASGNRSVAEQILKTIAKRL